MRQEGKAEVMISNAGMAGGDSLLDTVEQRKLYVLMRQTPMGSDRPERTRHLVEDLGNVAR